MPEPKSTKNRVHVDIDVAPDAPPAGDERREAARAHAARLTARGATLSRELDEPVGRCVVIADPEGDEFCLH